MGQAFLIKNEIETLGDIFSLVIVDNKYVTNPWNASYNTFQQYINAELKNPYETLEAALQDLDKIFSNYPYYSTKYVQSDTPIKNAKSFIPEERVNNFVKSLISQWILDSNYFGSGAQKYQCTDNANVGPYTTNGISNDTYTYFPVAIEGTTNITYDSGTRNHTLGIRIPIECIDEESLIDGTFNITRSSIVYEHIIFVYIELQTGQSGKYNIRINPDSNYPLKRNYSDIQKWLHGLTPTPLPQFSTDPYAPGGTNQPGGGSGLVPGTGGGLSGVGGGGSFSAQSTPIPLPGLPSLSGISTGFCGLFNPSASQLRSLAQFMWSDDFVTNIVKLFGDPMDVILGLNIVPVKPATSGSAEVTAGFISTGVSMPVVSSQYVQLDCGSIAVSEFWGSCLDYSPYTQVQIYLPYIGTHQLDIDEIMDKTIHLIYNIDVLSGSCVACLQCGESTLYSFNGSCASSIPVTGQNFNTIISTAVELAAGVGAFVATGAAAPLVSAASGAMTAATSGGMKPTVQHSGSVQATNGLLGVQVPYLIFTLPEQSVPENQNEYQGYPSNMTLLLGNCSGYTKCAELHLVNIPATKPELDEIESLLKRGVLI